MNTKITSPRLSLRLLEATDAADIFEYAKDPRVAVNTSWPAHQSLADTQAFLDHVLSRHNEVFGHLHLVWGIQLKSQAPIIGTISFGQDSEDSGHIDYAIGVEYWKKGYTSEALGSLLSYLFKNYPLLTKLRSGCLSRNIGSVRVLEKNGFQIIEKESSIRGGKFGGEFLETTKFLLTRADYLSQNKDANEAHTSD